MANKIDGILFKEMLSSGAALLTQNRENVDALNVFPVPDGDTGTNMTQTITSAIKEMNAKPLTSVSDISAAVARGALKGARGNSGVILSQILRGYARALTECEEIDSALLIKMVREGANTAYKAVMKPKEGTILTVARVIAEEVEKKCTPEDEIEKVFACIIKYGDAILLKTPDMLPVLKQAGVVDSGGMGLMVVLKGMYAALTGESVTIEAEEKNVGAMAGEFVDDHGDLRVEDIQFGYCTEFIVSHPKPEMTERHVAKLRERLERIGDCVLVISDMSVVKVHVHTNEPGRALQYALELGELDSIKIDNMFEEARERQAKREAEEAKKAAEMKEYGIVSVVLGKGLEALFNDLKVDKVVDGGQTMNPSIQDLADAVNSIPAKNVIILPNNSNIILAAQQACDLTERNVIVLPTKSVPMGIAAVLAFDPEAEPAVNEENMTAAAMNVHTASVTFAVRDTNYDGHEIHMNDIMGMIDNKLEFVGHDVSEVAQQCAEKMITDESSLITVYYGEDMTEDDAQALADKLEESYPDCDVEVQNGGQPLYYCLIAVE